MSRYIQLILPLLLVAPVVAAPRRGRPPEEAEYDPQLKHAEEQDCDVATLEAYSLRLQKLLAEVGNGRPRPRVPATQPAARPNPRQQMLVVLSTPLVFNNRDLADCLDAFQQAAQVRLIADWADLRVAGVEPKMPITLRMTRFDELCKAASPTARLVTYVEDDVVHVTTESARDKTIVTRTYDVAELLPGGGKVQAENDSLVDLIQSTVANQCRVVGGAWNTNGGTMTLLHDKLTVTQSRTYQEAVFSLVEQLRGSSPATAFRLLRERLAASTANKQALRAEVDDLAARCRTAHVRVPREPAAPYKGMGKVLPRLTFNKRPFGECLDAVAERAGIWIEPNWKELEAEGVSDKTPITLDTRGAAAADVIDSLMKAAGAAAPAGGGKARVNYAVGSTAVEVTTEAALMARIVVETYDIRDLVPDGTTAKGQAAIHALVSDLRKDVAPDTWDGRGAKITEAPGGAGFLVISQGAHVHRQLHAYLDARRHQKKR